MGTPTRSAGAGARTPWCACRWGRWSRRSDASWTRCVWSCFLFVSLVMDRPPSFYLCLTGRLPPLRARGGGGPGRAHGLPHRRKRGAPGAGQLRTSRPHPQGHERLGGLPRAGPPRGAALLRAGAPDDRGRRAGRVPQRGQVHAARRPLAGPPQGGALCLHHAAPDGGAGGVHGRGVRDGGGLARADRGGPRQQGACGRKIGLP